MKLVLNEEKKIASRSRYRTPPRTLRKLAAGPMIFELDKSLNKPKLGDWDRFFVRNIGLAVARRMGSKFSGDVERFREEAVRNLLSMTGMRTSDWREAELSALRDFADMLSLVEDLNNWSGPEKRALVRVIRAKAASDEADYLELMQKHPRLRMAMIKLGSQSNES